MQGELPAEEDKGGNEMTLNELITKAAGVRDRFSSADLTLTMTEMGQGRRVKDIALDPYSEEGTYKVRVTFETEEPETRPTAEERFRQVRSRLMARGLDPFGSRSRDIPTVALRQCVFLMLRREGYTYHAIARAALYDHSTVVWGRNKALDLINLGDPLYQRVWNDLNWIDLGLL